MKILTFSLAETWTLISNARKTGKGFLHYGQLHSISFSSTIRIIAQPKLEKSLTVISVTVYDTQTSLC